MWGISFLQENEPGTSYFFGRPLTDVADIRHQTSEVPPQRVNFREKFELRIDERSHIRSANGRIRRGEHRTADR